jgi:hypothetical protein
MLSKRQNECNRSFGGLPTRLKPEAAMHWTETRMGVTEEGAAENTDLGWGSPIRKRSLKDRVTNGKKLTMKMGIG